MICSSRVCPFVVGVYTAMLVLALDTASGIGQDTSLLELARRAAEGDTQAYHSVLRQYGKYQELVAAKRIPIEYAEVLDNRVWSDCMDACNEMKRRHGANLQRIELPGSAGRRLEYGGKYVLGRSDIDLKIEGDAADIAAEELEHALRKKYGVDPRSLGVNPLARVDPNDHEALLRAQAHPEKYCTPGGLKALEYENFKNGVAIVWDEEGRARRVSLETLYQKNGWPPPERPAALDAFEGVADQQKFLNTAVREGMSGEALARHDAKYYLRSVAKAELAGVDVHKGHANLLKEIEAVARTKNVKAALHDRIQRHGGVVESAVAEYVQETQAFQRELTTETFNRHCRLIAEGKRRGGAFAAEAVNAEKNLEYALAALSKKQAETLLNAAEGPTWTKTQSADVLSRASRVRVDAAILAENSKIDASRVAHFQQLLADELRLSEGERDALAKRLDLVGTTPTGRRLLNTMMTYARKHPIKSGMLALVIYHDVKEVATKAGAEGIGQGGLLAGNKAADWTLMLASPHYATARIAEFAGRLTFEFGMLNPMKEFAGQRAYEGAAGFLGSLNLGRGELTRRYGLHNEEQAVKEAEAWYDAWMTGKGEAIGMRSEIRAGGQEKINEVRDAFIRQLRDDYRQSQWLQMARDYSYDAKTGEYGGEGFFSQVGNGEITFENFAIRFPTEEGARNAIDYYLRENWTYDWDKYKGEPTERDEREAFLRNYLISLWKLSVTHNQKLAKAREEAEKKLEEARAIGADPQQQAEWRENVVRDFYLNYQNREVDRQWEQAAVVGSKSAEQQPPPDAETPPPLVETPAPPKQAKKPDDRNLSPPPVPVPLQVSLHRILAALPSSGRVALGEFDLDFSDNRIDDDKDPDQIRIVREWSGYRQLICQGDRGPAMGIDLLMVQVIVTYNVKGNPGADTPKAFRDHIVKTADAHLRAPHKYHAKTPVDALPGAVLCTKRWKTEERTGANYDFFVWQSPLCHIAVKCSFYVTMHYRCSPTNSERFNELNAFTSTTCRELAEEIHARLQDTDAEPPDR